TRGMPGVTEALTLARARVLAGDAVGAASDFERASTSALARGQRTASLLARLEGAALTTNPEDVARGERELEAAGMYAWVRSATRSTGNSRLERSAASPAGLSAREIEVLRLLASGKANKEIAAALFISVATVERHVANLYAKIGARGRAQATAFAL